MKQKRPCFIGAKRADLEKIPSLWVIWGTIQMNFGLFPTTFSPLFFAHLTIFQSCTLSIRVHFELECTTKRMMKQKVNFGLLFRHSDWSKNLLITAKKSTRMLKRVTRHCHKLLLFCGCEK